MQNLVLVNSLSHSGSTVLSMVLAGHDNLISLGEVFQVLREDPSRWLDDAEAVCSCGAKAGDCNVWGTALRKIAENPALAMTENKYDNINEKYQIVLQTFNEVYGDKILAVDTSKGFRHLKQITNDDNINIETIFLMRDARAYATSQTRIARAQKRKGLRKIKQSTLFQLIKWYIGNRQRQKYIKEKKLNAHQTSYENLCFHSEDTVRDLCDFLDIPYQDKMIQLTDTQHHILFGNPMRLNKQKQMSLSYDSRWLANNEWTTPFALFGRIKKYNKKYIYNKN